MGNYVLSFSYSKVMNIFSHNSCTSTSYEYNINYQSSMYIKNLNGKMHKLNMFLFHKICLFNPI